MDNLVYSDDFDRGTVCDRLSEISAMIDEEKRKNEDEMDADRIRELMFAQMIEGLKLNTNMGGRGFGF